MVDKQFREDCPVLIDLWIPDEVVVWEKAAEMMFDSCHCFGVLSVWSDLGKQRLPSLERPLCKSACVFHVCCSLSGLDNVMLALKIQVTSVKQHINAHTVRGSPARLTTSSTQARLWFSVASATLNITAVCQHFILTLKSDQKTES